MAIIKRTSKGRVLIPDDDNVLVEDPKEPVLIKDKGEPILVEDKTNQARPINSSALKLGLAALSPSLATSVYKDERQDIEKSFLRGGTSTLKGIGGVLSAVGFEGSGERLKKFSDKIDNRYLKLKKENAIQNKIAQAAGSGATFFVPGLGISKATSMLTTAPRLAAWLGTGASAILESSVDSGNIYNQSLEKGMTETEAKENAAKYFAANLPTNIVLNKWMFSHLPSGGRIKSTLMAGGQEAAQSAIQQTIQNIVLHDPTLANVGESALLGGVVGSGFQGGRHVYDIASSKPSLPTTKPSPVFQNSPMENKANQVSITQRNLDQPQLQQQRKQQQQQPTNPDVLSRELGAYYPNISGLTPEDAQQVIKTYWEQDHAYLDTPAKEKKKQAFIVAQKENATTQSTLEGSIDALLQIKKTKPVEEKNITVPKSLNSEIDFRKEAANGLGQETLMNKIKKQVQAVKENTRHFPKLESDKDGQIMETLRQFEDSGSVSKTKAKFILQGILDGLGPKRYEVFKWNVIYPDLIKDNTTPFGYNNVLEIQNDYNKFKAVADSDPVISNALQSHKTFMANLRNELVDNGLLSDKTRPEDYFHRQTMEIMALKDPKYVGASADSDIKLREKGFQKKRSDSNADFNTDYLESQFQVISQSLQQLHTKKVIDSIEKLYDIKPKLIEASKRDSSIQSMNAGKDNPVKSLDDLIPDGYVKWAPKEGNAFYVVNSIPEQIMNEYFSGQRKLLKPEDIKEVLAVGKQRKELIIPQRIAETLDNFKDFKSSGAIGDFAKYLNTTWKQTMLFNPLRVIKYNLNNTSGDLDIAMAYNPKMLKHLPSAAKELYAFNITKKDMSPFIKTALEKGVINSGQFLNEIPDIRKEGAFKWLNNKDFNGPKGENIISKYWTKVGDYSGYRENLLRVAAFKQFREDLVAGKKVYGASDKAEIDQITDIDDKAAKLARELIGDYGNLSQAGMWIRDHMMPFYSWMEVNTPRYYRLLKNTAHEGTTSKSKIIGVKAAKTGLNVVKLGILANTILAAGSLWNRLVYPKEEQELRSNNRQFHLILGRDDETGEIRTLRLNGALSDSLSFFGLEDLPHDIQDVRSGKSTVKDKVKEGGISFASKMYSSLSPVKAGIEAATGKTLYPDITKPRNIRNTGEYLASAAGVKPLYRIAAGLPSKGPLEELKQSVLYKSDPGEAAYQSIQSKGRDFIEKNGIEAPSQEPTSKSNALYYYRQAVKLGDEKAKKKYWQKYVNLGGTRKGMKTSIKNAKPLSFMRDTGQNKNVRKRFISTLSKEDQEELRLANEWYVRTYLK